MAHENVEVVRRVTDVMDRESFEAAVPVFAEVAHPDGRGRGRTSGAQGALDLAIVFTVQDEAITAVEFYLERAEALEAVGLPKT